MKKLFIRLCVLASVCSISAMDKQVQDEGGVRWQDQLLQPEEGIYTLVDFEDVDLEDGERRLFVLAALCDLEEQWQADHGRYLALEKRAIRALNSKDDDCVIVIPKGGDLANID